MTATTIACLCAAFAVMSAADARAQAVAQPQPTPASTPTAPAPCCVIPAGAPVIVELTERISSDTATSGESFGLRLAEPIVVQGRVVVPVGAAGRGEVIDAKAAGMGGRPGRLVLAARCLDSGSLHVRLQSLKLGGGGQDNSVLASGATLAVGVIGALVTGGDVAYLAGTRASAKIAADVVIPPPAPPPPRPPASISEP